MKKITMIAALIAVLMTPTAVVPAAGDVRVAGEKLDSGLGTMIYGESLDSGLGDLPNTYTAAEYMPASWVRGESMDSGLGDLPRTYTAAEYQPVIMSARSVVER